ncbi:MAG: hypothetical protein DI551_01285 [Micavibrio aeruginosavorus]|uniref:HD domain-containing protein n=1 Tax=Micavibrio aeruginosavorus TaxID=349221 RepID=A0A2W5N553_9BACT|nr:MAG: hypothetical protein DI551_01285 [Micavibrio aeruginosavorus]
MLPIFQLIETKVAQSFQFIIDVGKLKGVLRQTHLQEWNRRENTAEHTWHLILMALVLKDKANINLNMERILSMLAVHDLGEIGIGDTFFYADNRKDAPKNERENFIKICKDLSPEASDYFLDLWDEFENGETEESKFARALDRFQPFLNNIENGGESWLRNKISLQAALSKNAPIQQGSPELWKYYQTLATECDRLGLFYKA